MRSVLMSGGFLCLFLSGCASSGPSAPYAVASLTPPIVSTQPPASSSAAALGPVVDAEGRCNTPPGTTASIELGIGECDLVHLKGHPPSDVLIGESGKGGREVQMLYSEPGAKEVYLFTDNKLSKIVK